MDYQFWGDRILDKLEDKHPDECSEGLPFGQYRLVAASVRGKMHIRNEIHREDAFAVYRNGDWLAVAVSDGVGSSQYSRLGATYAVNSACQNLLDETSRLARPKKAVISWPFFMAKEHITQPEELVKMISEAFCSTAKALREYVDRLAIILETQQSTDDAGSIAPGIQSTTESICCGVQQIEDDYEEEDSPIGKLAPPSRSATIALRDFHCTLLVLALNLRSGTMVVGQIGDGLILGLTADEVAVPLVETKVPGQTGQTYVITQRDWECYWSYKVISSEQSRDYTTIYLMTDGVADDCQYGPPEDILQRWANDVNAEIRKYDLETTKERLRMYLNDYEVKGSYDDRTLVAVYK